MDGRQQGKEAGKMILIAILAPVIVMGVLLAGAATISMIVVGVAALGALVAASLERVSHSISNGREAGQPGTGARAQGWPQPTAEAETVYGDFSPAWDIIDEKAYQPLLVEDPVLVGFSTAPRSTCGSGVHSWEEVFPVDETDFEGPDAYTLIADPTEGL
jgi:hypothetical protein